jgi:hypothetical protein
VAATTTGSGSGIEPATGNGNAVSLVAYNITSKNEGTTPNLKRWDEYDVNPEIDVMLLKNIDLSFYSLNFFSPNNAFATINNFEFQITYNDTSLLGPFALHPSFVYQKELTNNSAIKSRGNLFEFNVTPGIQLIKGGNFPTKVDFPLSLGLGDDRSSMAAPLSATLRFRLFRRSIWHSFR